MKSILFCNRSRILIWINTIYLIVFVSCTTRPQGPEISIITDNHPGTPVLHGINKLTEALVAKNISYEKVFSLDEAKAKTIIVAGIPNGDGLAASMIKDCNRIIPEVPEALTIWKTNSKQKTIWVVSGSDNRGLMYGLLDLADRIVWTDKGKPPLDEVEEITEKPDVSERALSVYVLNRAYWESRFYDNAYWTKYLDMLAQNRFNTLVVILGYNYDGFLSPSFPYFFNVEEFPYVKMVGLTSGDQIRNTEALRNLINMTHDRGMNITVGFWDYIYRGGARGKSVPGKEAIPRDSVPGLVWGVTTDNLAAYNMAALAKFVRTFPDVDALHFRMHWESGLRKEEMKGFWHGVFVKMKEIAPDLRLDLRAKELSDSIVQDAINVGVKFRIDTKFWMEQMGMPYHPTQVNPEVEYRRHSYGDMLHYPQQYKMHWRLWNGGTSRILLWGDPQYVRQFAESTHLYDGDGFEVNEPLASKMMVQPRDAKSFDLLNPQFRYYDYEFQRYWHFFQVFGRIGYNPQATPLLWKKEFEKRFGKKAAPLVEEALHKASWILPRIVASCYPYSYFPMSRGWAEKQRLGDLPTYASAAGSDLRQFASFDEEAMILLNGGETAKLLPSMTSLWFEQTSTDIDRLIRKAEKVIGNNQNNEFISTITDLKILSNLALYHSKRIPAAVSYRLFVHSNDISLLDDAISYEQDAIEAWRQIVKAAGQVYTMDLRMGNPDSELCGHWKDELTYLEKGLLRLEQKRNEFKSASEIKIAAHYKSAKTIDNAKLFEISHTTIKESPAGKPISVGIKVKAHNGVKWVHLLCRSVNQEMDYHTLQMLPDKEKDIYQITIPAELINPRWDFMYLFEIMDDNGNGSVYPDLNDGIPYIVVKLNR